MSTNQIDQLILFQRLLIIFGSICFLWLIIGIIFLSIETYRYLKKKSSKKFSTIHTLPLNLPSTIFSSSKQTSTGDYTSENEINDDDDGLDDQTSIMTSVSFISEKPSMNHEHPYYISSCRRISEEQLALKFPSPTGTSNLAYSSSTLLSSGDNDRPLYYYPAYRNFAYSQSSLASTNENFDQKMSTRSVPVPSMNSTPSIHQLNFERQSSTNTIMSQLTHETCLSPAKSPMKTIPLPTNSNQKKTGTVLDLS
ncbi:unnamed protein product [Adineta ricciae]|uniref:Uncharacterized protein n=1 Tax=Adineta ricciae TaxID=249248 RepID=A0A815TUB5_ADIRI|nr:unnamed protein product [Adineta ricciae]CAF1510755.1 unnamed protein product [Adineta ricciae]